MTGNKVRVFHQIGGADRRFPKAQMGNGVAARFFGVVLKVALYEQVGVVADDFNGVFVGAHRAVRAETVKLAGGIVARGQSEIVCRQRAKAHVIVNSDGEFVFRGKRAQIFKGCVDHGRSKLLGAQPVPAPKNTDIRTPVFRQGGANVEI